MLPFFLVALLVLFPCSSLRQAVHCMQWKVGETSMPHTRPSAIQKLRKKPSTKSKKLPSVKNQIRSVQRLLAKVGWKVCLHPQLCINPTTTSTGQHQCKNTGKSATTAAGAGSNPGRAQAHRAGKDACTPLPQGAWVTLQTAHIFIHYLIKPYRCAFLSAESSHAHCTSCRHQFRVVTRQQHKHGSYNSCKQICNT